MSVVLYCHSFMLQWPISLSWNHVFALDFQYVMRIYWTLALYIFMKYYTKIHSFFHQYNFFYRALRGKSNTLAGQKINNFPNNIVSVCCKSRFIEYSAAVCITFYYMISAYQMKICSILLSGQCSLCFHIQSTPIDAEERERDRLIKHYMEIHSQIL